MHGPLIGRHLACEAPAQRHLHLSPLLAELLKDPACILRYVGRASEGHAQQPHVSSLAEKSYAWHAPNAGSNLSAA